ncbi:hypothetical protein HJC23_004472 [Cyclotella cryptica]|uniref:Uncharacterized protein n=1 Tax=Cyclotella cryptica TaxID=29204 RepID=A0ABD3QG08_9STRA
MENPPLQSPVEHAEPTSDPLLDLANYLDAVTYFSLLQNHASTPTGRQVQIMKSKPKSKVPASRKNECNIVSSYSKRLCDRHLHQTLLKL